MPKIPNPPINSDAVTLRDYFAAHAPIMTREWHKKHGGEWLEAESAYKFAYADAMLEERLK